MIRTMTIIGLLAAFFTGCVDNEQSLYLEHVKTLPEFPDCEVSTGDPVAPLYSVDLFLADVPWAYYMATNALMIRNDYSNLDAESNGILIDGYELYTLIPGLGAVGGTEYFEYNHYIAPESSTVIFAELMSQSTINALRSAYSCTPMSPEAITSAIINRDMDVLDQLNNSTVPETMYAVVRFLGHTQAGKEVQTQEFSFKMLTHCGPVDGWDSCFDIGDDPQNPNHCSAFCTAASYPYSCSTGVNIRGAHCSAYLASTEYIVPDPDTLEPTTYCDVYCTAGGK